MMFHWSLLLVPLAAEAATCVDEAGESVDWWFALKYPLAASDDCAGQCYSYMTSETLTWTQSTYLVTDTTSIMGMQMADIYAQKSGLSYVLYNDQWPNGDWTENYGHSKGTFAYDSDGGWFMQHSVPDYPNYVADGYLYGGSQEKYGQLLSCFSYDVSSFDSLAYAMRFSGPWIYDTNLDSSSTSGNLSALLNAETFYYDPESVAIPLTTSGGLSVSLFAKTGNFGADMVDKVVVPGLGGVSMWSQSWLNSCTKVGAYCPSDGGDVVDVLESLYGTDTVAWPTSDDHSKWTVDSDSIGWVCALDNNRCTSQYVRGGLAQCFKNSALYSVLVTGTQSTDKCDSYSDDDDDNFGIDDTPASSCAAIGCGNYISGALCACNDSCSDYDDCCDDFENLCGPGSDDDKDDAKDDDDGFSDDSNLACCHYTDKSCNSGDVCCLESCDDPTSCSYTESGCTGYYGQLHDCEWTGSLCVVGAANASSALHR